MQKLFSLFSLLLIFTISTFAQESQGVCGSDFVHAKQLQSKYYQEKIQEVEQVVQARIAEKKLKKTKEVLHTIPIVVHVIHLGEAVGVGNNISDAQVESGIQQLNDAFRNKSGLGVDVNIAFALAKLDPNCSSTNGIVRVDGSGVASYSSAGVSLGGSGAAEEDIKALSKWPNSSYYNIWLITEINNNNGGSGTQGFAYFPGAGPDVDGAMILNSSWGDQGTAKSWNNQGETGVHEIGHALDLYHTFEGDNDGNSCPSDGCGSDLGDCCDDTPPHIRSASNCVVGTNSCDGGSSTELFIHNYMDYSSQSCAYLFTADQKARMRAALETERSGLISSKALDASIVFSEPKAPACQPTTGATGLDFNTAGILNVKIGDLDYTSGYPKQDGGYLDVASNCLSAITVYKANTPDLSVTVGVNTNRVKAWIDYNNDGSFDESTEKVFDQTISSKATGTSTIVFPSNAVLDTYLRMRVMNDLSTPTNSCYNPSRGQAEDYAIIIKSVLASNVAVADKVAIYPNPFSNSFTLTGLNSEIPSAYQIFDLTGKLVLSGSVSSSSLTIDASGLLIGSYFIRVQSGGHSFSKKLVKLD